YVYFIGDVGGDRHLFRMPSGGGHVDRLTQGERTLAGFSFSRAFDRMAYTAADPVHPAETYAARIDGSNEVKLSTFNAAWLKQTDLNAAERIHFPSADGTQVEGWIMLPRAAKPPYPLILAIHAGPHGSYGSAFDNEFH